MTVDWRNHPEYDEFLRGFIPGHVEGEIADAFESEFGIRLTRSQVKNSKTRLGVRSGTHGGQFEKGLVPANKGRTWDEMGIPEESRARMRATQFKEGTIPPNALRCPIGTERVTRDGYVEVKVAERPIGKRSAHDNWRPKAHIAWEEANGRELEPGEVVVFADGNRSNFDAGNLVAMTRAEHGVICNEGIPYHDAESCGLAVEMARLRLAIGKVKMRPRECNACGRTFEPRFPRQRNCDACIAAGITRRSRS